MAFYISAPHHGGYLIDGRYAIFEGVKEDEYTIRVISPEFRAKWPTVSPKWVIETSGPVRTLTVKEYQAIFKD